MEVDGGNLVIIISRIIENTLLKVIAGAIKSVFVFVVTSRFVGRQNGGYGRID